MMAGLMAAVMHHTTISTLVLYTKGANEVDNKANKAIMMDFIVYALTSLLT